MINARVFAFSLNIYALKSYYLAYEILIAIF
jgi:hypothetical protein